MVLISENITENDMAAEQTLVPLATERQEDYDLEGEQQDFITPDSKMDGVKMSPTNENNSQNSSELENVTTGWEIQPYVEDPMKHFCRQSLNIQLISKVLKQLVTQSTSQLKQVSTWETKHGKTSVEISVSFKLPEDCGIDIAEVDKIIRPPVPQDGDLNNVNTQNVPQFSFSERLNGWNIERRQRSNGKSCDMYYRHESSRRTFRSTVEVVNFLLYEVYPPKQQRVPNKSKSEGVCLEQRSQRGKGLLKRKMASPISGASSSKSKEKMYLLSDVCEEYMNATVEELLAAAYLNVLNSSSNSSMQGGSEPIEHSEFSSDYMNPKEAQEMVEEFLDSSYKNLLNHFNEKENVPQENKKGRVDEHKDEGQSSVNTIQEQENVAEVQTNVVEVEDKIENKKGRVDEHKNEGQSGINPIQEQANVVEVQTNVVEVEDNPTEVEANAGEFSSSPSAYTEQCDLINHIPHVSECELAFLLGNN